MNMKIIGVGVVLFVVLLVVGGYWYLGLYQPKQFAEELVFLYEDTVAGVFRTETPKVPVRDAQDYAGVRAELAARKEYFERAGRKLGQMTPPMFGGGEAAHKQFSDFVARERDILNGLEKKAQFLEVALKLFGHLQARPLYPAERGTVDIVVSLRDRGSDMQLAARDLFLIGPVDVNPTIPFWGMDDKPMVISYDAIQSVWQEIQPYFEEMIREVSLVQNFEGPQNKNRWPRTVSREELYNRWLPFADKEANKKMDRFMQLLRDAILRNSAKDMAVVRYYVNPTREDTERREAFLRVIEGLRSKYSN